MSIDEFNAYMAQNGFHTTTATLTFDVTNVDPDDYATTKGAVAEFGNSACAGSSGFVTKLYGPDNPPNLSHPPGTLKQEYNDTCCAAADCPEGWANPNPGEAIFVDAAQQCQVTVWIDPAEHGYEVDCDGVVHEAVGANMYGIEVDVVSILVGTDGSLWPMPNAISTTNEICFEEPTEPDPNPELETADVIAVEDVTASAVDPAAVYPLVDDLSCGAGDSEFFLKFDLSDLPGPVQAAELHLRSWPDGSGDGDGADVYLVLDNEWSEDTLTWNTRPPISGAALDRVSPVGLDQAYVLDVSAAVADPGVYSFALVPQAGDLNGVHFHSKESSAVLGPTLHVEYVADDGASAGDSGGGGSSGGGDGNPSTGASTTASDGGTQSSGNGTSGAGGGLPPFGGDRGGDSGCSCSGGRQGDHLAWSALTILGLLGFRRRSGRRHSAAEPRPGG